MWLCVSGMDKISYICKRKQKNSHTMKLLEGKVALVTGAARGIGKAIALRFAAEGAAVAFTDLVINEAAEQTLAELEAYGIKAKAYASNAASFEESHEVVKQIMEDFGRIDVLVNNAGITKDGLMMRMSEAQWDAVINVNLKSAFNFIHAVTPIMARQRGGCRRFGQRRSVQLLCFEGRYDWSGEVYRQGDGSPWYPRQRYCSGLHHHRDDQPAPAGGS